MNTYRIKVESRVEAATPVSAVKTFLDQLGAHGIEIDTLEVVKPGGVMQ